jgi:Family of unknown function (DUF5689)
MKKVHIIILIALVSIIAGVSSCRKKAEVPLDAASYDPALPVTGTILQLKKLLGGAVPVQITEDLTIAGVVTADDRGGNFYKQIMIQDSTAGIALLIEKSGLYNDYPVGRKIYIKCKGLYVGAYSGFKQIGFALDETGSLVGVPANMMSTVIVKGPYKADLSLLPQESTTVFDLKSSVTNDALVGRLLYMDSVQFLQTQAGPTYAQPAALASGTDRLLEQCGNAATIVLRTSGYAKFAAEPWTKKRGRLHFIFSRYNTTAQLMIRDLNDVQFTDSVRCGGVVLQPPTPISIKTLREFYTDSVNSAVVIMGNYQIHGTIINSFADSNSGKTAGSYYMQDESGRGINMYIAGAYYQLGDSLTIEVNRNNLIVYRGNLEITKGTGSSLVVNKVGSGKNVEPKVLTTAQITADLKKPFYKDRLYECTLVKIENPTITGSLTYSGITTIADASGTIATYVAPAGILKTTTLPLTYTSLTGIASNFVGFGTPAPPPYGQVNIRKISDIK